MINFIKKILYSLAKVFVSVGLFAAGAYCFNHHSSSAFELGLFLIGAGLCHYVWWPKLAFDVEKNND